jgi:hypothetical protein
MKKIAERLEGVIDEQITAFENNPVKTGLKFVILLFILIWVWKKVKEAI